MVCIKSTIYENDIVQLLRRYHHEQTKESKTMTEQHRKTAELILRVKQQRDELKLQIHLGGQEAKEEWKKQEEIFQRMMADYEPVKHAVDETAGKLWESLKLVADEISDGFHRIRKSI
jgi:hypothetical protein